VNLFTIPPPVPFLDTLAAGWLARGGDPDGDRLAASRGLILLPTRRAARALAEAFLRATDGRPLLLPRITALGALDEAPLALAGALALPPAVEPMQRLAMLGKLILAMDGANGAPRSAEGAWRLAGDLAALMDEAERAEIDLARALPAAADAAFAEHWGRTLCFLEIVTANWPHWLAEQGLANPAARQVLLLDAQARAWSAEPPDHPVWIAGTTGGIPAVARLLRTVARLEQGRVVLPGLDAGLDDAAWQALDETHPQAGLRRLLTALDARRADVRDWPTAVTRDDGGARVGLLRGALLPADALAAWRLEPPPAPAGLWRLTAADQQEEAAAIALVLRDALERPGARAALVTPDRALAGRVGAELLRFGVVADDSAGETLAQTPPGVFLRLLAAAIDEALAPVPLLALLKHPLAAAGLSEAACRQAARALELACLRGPRPGAGLAGLRRALDRAGTPPEARDLLARLEACAEPALRMAAAVSAPPGAMVAALIDAAERLAATDAEAGTKRLWAAEEGEALATRLAAALAALPILPDQPRGALPGLLDALLEGGVVRSRRALRGGESGGAEHPRVFIWGLLEARLQTAEVMVLGGLAEGVWPPATDPGPWLSRPMRAKVGLPSPEAAVGQAAHDFVACSCAAPIVVLSCPRRRDRAPAVPARWLTRLDAYLRSALPEHPAAGWAAAMDQPAGGPKPVGPPRPCPPLARRPRRLSVTEIEIWQRDPYAIHARHILRLSPLDPLDQSTDAADYGKLVHAGIHRFLVAHGAANGAHWPADAAPLLRAALSHALQAERLRPALEAWWAPRFERIADWIAAHETARRAAAPPAAILSELKGQWRLASRDFLLVGRADRIEIGADGNLAILDYKTGQPPPRRDIAAGLTLQLPLEAAMAAEGAFAGVPRGSATGALLYWHLTGGHTAGDEKPIRPKPPETIADQIAGAVARLEALIDAYDRPAQSYLSQPRPGAAPRYTDYAQLARVAEWAGVDDDDDGEAGG
jgi:ATP-dependent helicase/nuclease subunit B